MKTSILFCFLLNEISQKMQNRFDFQCITRHKSDVCLFVCHICCLILCTKPDSPPLSKSISEAHHWISLSVSATPSQHYIGFRKLVKQFCGIEFEMCLAFNGSSVTRHIASLQRCVEDVLQVGLLCSCLQFQL